MSGTDTATPVSMIMVLKEDLAELHRSVSNWATSEIPVYANRLATDAGFLADETGRNEALFLGAALRIASEDILQAGARLSASEKPKDELLETCSTFFQRVSEVLPNLRSEFEKACEAYYRFELDVTRFQRMSAEQSSESLSGPLDPPAWKLLSPILLRNAEHLTEPRSLLADGIANELSRLSRVYLFETKDLALFTALHSFGLLSQYFRFVFMVPPAEIYETAIQAYKAEFKQSSDSLAKFVGSLTSVPADGSEWRLARDFVAPVIWRWREFFMLYMEVGRPGMAIVGQPVGEGPSVRPEGRKAEFVRERRRK